MPRSKRKKRKERRAQNNSFIHPADILVPVNPKTDGQARYLDSIEDYPITICNGPAGTGKAQPLNALVLTDQGYKKMKDLEIGEAVAHPSGLFSKIVGIFPQGKKEIFKVSFSDGTSTECCADHLWYTETALDRDAHRKGSVKTTKEIMKTLITKNNKKNHSIPMTQPIQFSKKDLPIDPYTLGILIGDGTLCAPNIILSTADEEILSSVTVGIKKIDSDLALTKAKGNKYDYRITKPKAIGKGVNRLKLKIRSLGLYGKKSSNKFIPEIYKYSSVNDRISLFQGLMDSDGTVDKRKSYSALSFTSISESLINDIKFLIESFGGKAKITSRYTRYTYKNKLKVGQKSYRINISLPKGIKPFRLKRKASLYQHPTKYKPARYISSIESIGFKNAQRIKVDNKDGLYLTNNFIVTHNTFISFAMALKYYLSKNAIDRIVIVRSTFPAGDEPALGFLPGDLNEKMSPLLAPILKDSARQLIKKIKRDYEVQSLLSSNRSSMNATAAIMNAILSKFDIEIVPLQFMRGRTFDRSFIILDEAQNCSMADFTLFLTRIGQQSKVIIEGDASQKDRPDGALPELMDRLEGLETVGVVDLDQRDIVRSPLISGILDRLKKTA